MYYQEQKVPLIVELLNVSILYVYSGVLYIYIERGVKVCAVNKGACVHGVVIMRAAALLPSVYRMVYRLSHGLSVVYRMVYRSLDMACRMYRKRLIMSKYRLMAQRMYSSVDILFSIICVSTTINNENSDAPPAEYISSSEEENGTNIWIIDKPVGLVRVVV